MKYLFLLLLITSSLFCKAQIERPFETPIEHQGDSPIPVEFFENCLNLDGLREPVEAGQLEQLVLESIKKTCSMEEMEAFTETEKEQVLIAWAKKLFEGPPPVYITKKEKGIQAYLGNAPDGILIFEVDAEDGYFVQASPSATKALCYTESQIKSMHFMCLINPQDVVYSMRKYLMRDRNINTANVDFTNSYYTGCEDFILLRWTGRTEIDGRLFVIAEVMGREK